MAGDPPVALIGSSRRLPLALAGLAVLGQIAYPLAGGVSRDRITVAVVIVFAAASITHAVLSRGVRVGGGAVAFAAVGGFAAEVVGVHTGVPFGDYVYGSALGPRLFGVPLVVALAWTMVAWPAAVVARRLTRRAVPRVVVGAWALASWDLFLDPQLVDAGGWSWRNPDPHLPGVPDVPLTNHAGWLLVALLLSAGLQWFLRADRGGDDGVPVLLYLWTYAGSIVALAGVPRPRRGRGVGRARHGAGRDPPRPNAAR